MAVWRIPAVMSGPVLHPAVNVFHVQTANATDADAQAAVDKIRDFYTGAALAFSSTATIAIGGNTRRVDVDPPTIPAVTTRQVTGTGAATTAQWQLANVVSWRTTTAGRSYRGRTYLGPLASGAVTGNTMTVAVNTAIGNAAAALIAAGGLVIRSEWHNGVRRDPPIHTLVTQSIVNGTIETQRRRATP